MSENRHKLMTIIFVLVFLGFLSSYLWCEDLCDPTPSPLPSPWAIQSGTHRIPPTPPETVVKIRTTTGEEAELSFQDWRMAIDWIGDPPAWWLGETWHDETFWFLDEYHSYCRHDCDHGPNDWDGEWEWVCRTECWAAFADSMTYRYYESLDCGETWPVTIDQEITYVPPVTIRRANLRLAPALPETG